MRKTMDYDKTKFPAIYPNPKRLAAYMSGREVSHCSTNKYLTMESLKRKLNTMKDTEFIMTIPFPQPQDSGGSHE